MKRFAKPNHGGYCRDRNKPCWNNFVTYQSIKQSGFASLELTDTGDIETPFRDSLRELTCFLGLRLGSQFLSEVSKPHQTGSAIQAHG